MKRTLICLLAALCFAAYQPVPVYAGFFLFNIINDVFNGGSKNKQKEKEQQPDINTTLKHGMQNSQVVILQQQLIKASYLKGKADGIFGYQTQQALKAFQRDSGLAVDGVAGPQTLAALKKYKPTKGSVKAPLKEEKKAPAKTPAKEEKKAAVKTPEKSAKPPKEVAKPPKTVTPPVNNGVPSYLYSLPMIATAYTRYDEGCTDYTYNGTYLRRGLVAVDPDVIPLGTRLYVPGYGEALADDIGGAIQGNRIDLAMDTLDEAFNWGVNHVTVYVLP